MRCRTSRVPAARRTSTVPSPSRPSTARGSGPAIDPWGSGLTAANVDIAVMLLHVSIKSKSTNEGFPTSGILDIAIESLCRESETERPIWSRSESEDAVPVDPHPRRRDDAGSNSRVRGSIAYSAWLIELRAENDARDQSIARLESRLGSMRVLADRRFRIPRIWPTMDSVANLDRSLGEPAGIVSIIRSANRDRSSLRPWMRER